MRDIKQSPLPRGEGWVRVPPPDQKLAVKRARTLRQNSTPAEVALWRILRDRTVLGAKPRRQVAVGPYFLDFAIISHRLAVEIDGETHATVEGAARDERRTAWLQAKGWSVLRFTNAEVMQNMPGVIHVIAEALARIPHPDPLPEGEGAVPLENFGVP